MAIIETISLVKRFDIGKKKGVSGDTLDKAVRRSREYVTAVNDVSFSIEPGECVAFLGPNGAGKSTTIKMLSGILVPSSGEISVMGRSPHRHRKENSYHVGVVFGQRSQLIAELSPREGFRLLACMYGIPKLEYARVLGTLGELLEIEEFLDRPVRILSLGQRMRCEIAAALLHQPEILFLDEPTIGLDVVVKERVRAFIERINRERGITVILTTHDLSDIERLCKRTIIIDKGRKVFDGSMASLRERYSGERSIRAHIAYQPQIQAVLEALRGREGLSIRAIDGGLEVSYDAKVADTASVLRDILGASSPSDIVVAEEKVESLIRRIYLSGSDARG